MSDVGIIKEDECIISVCKYYLPCGWCELKQKECGKYFAMMYPRNYEPYMPNTVQVYAAPSGAPIITNEVNCGARMDGNEQISYADLVVKRE